MGCLAGPECEVRRVGFGIADVGVESLRIVEEEASIEAAAQSRLQVSVQSPGIVALEDYGRWYRRIRRKTTNRTVLPIEEHFRTPDETTVGRLAERDIAVRNVQTGQLPIRLLLAGDLRRISIAHA